MKFYFLELILTKKCNKTCYYCNVHSMTNPSFNSEIDLDFLKYILKYIPDNTMIEFCGGEPGLLTNLEDAFHVVYSHPKVKRLQIMSNGLVRLKGYDFLEKDNVYYCEHLIKEIDDKKVLKFYDDLEFLERSRWRYVVVTTKKTIESLDSNYKFYKNLGFFRDMFWYKIMNPKTHGINSFIYLIESFFKKLKNEDHIDADFTLDRIKVIKYLDQKAAAKRVMCGWNSPQPTIDFETKELVHCGAYLERSYRRRYCPEFFKSHLCCKLFEPGEYCDTCYIYAENQIRSIVSCRRGNYYNMEV